MPDDTYTTKNYQKQGGDKWVVGGEIEFLPEASIKGLPTPGKAANQPASVAKQVAAIKDDFNALLEKLKAAGLMVADGEQDE